MCFTVITFLGPRAGYREPYQVLSVQPILLLSNFGVTDHSSVPTSLFIFTFSRREHFIALSNQGMSPWMTSSEFWILWGTTPDYYRFSLSITEHFQWHHCCLQYDAAAVGSMKLTRNGTRKSWKGTSAFLMHLTPVVTRKITAFISILLGDVEGERLFRSSFSMHNRSQTASVHFYRESISLSRSNLVR